RVYPAECVIRAKLDDRRVGILRKSPVEALQASRGGVAGDTGVDHLDGISLVAQGLFELCWKCFAGLQSIAGRQAVPEGNDANGTRLSPDVARPDRHKQAGIDEDSEHAHLCR